MGYQFLHIAPLNSQWEGLKSGNILMLVWRNNLMRMLTNFGQKVSISFQGIFLRDDCDPSMDQHVDMDPTLITVLILSGMSAL